MRTVADIGTLPPATSLVECGGQRHRVNWDAGALFAADHGDPQGERALAVLGGQKVACMDVLTAWAEHAHDPRVLTVLTRGPGDGIRADLRLDHCGELGLLALAGEVQQRLIASVTARLLSALASGEAGAERALPVLEVSLMTRAKKALESWLHRALTDGQVEVAKEEDGAVVEEVDGGSLHAALPLRWVADIWGRGLAVVGGRFSLALVEASPGRAVLETIGDDFQSPRLLTVELE